MSNFSNLLPCEIMENIIPRLPLKSVKRFLCVSKSWNSFITSPFFVNKHLELSKHNSDNNKLLISSNVKNPNKFHKMDSPLDVKFHKYTLLGFCNGVACLKNVSSQVSLWNPATKERIIVRKASAYECHGPNSYGFGYSAKSDDYIVCKFYCPKLFHGYNSFMEVYSLRCNEWSLIQEIPYSTVDDEAGILVSGVVHWLSTPCTNKETFFIFAFDLDEKSFCKLSLPDCEVNASVGTRLDTLDGCLCSLRRTKLRHVELWMMKEYGNTTSWTMLYNIQIDGMICYSKLLCFTDFGAKLLLRDGNNILSFDTKDGSSKMVISLNIAEDHFGAVAYKESFVSPQHYYRRDCCCVKLSREARKRNKKRKRS